MMNELRLAFNLGNDHIQIDYEDLYRGETSRTVFSQSVESEQEIAERIGREVLAYLMNCK